MPSKYYEPFNFAPLHVMAKIAAKDDSQFDKFESISEKYRLSMSELEQKLSDALGSIAMRHFDIGGTISPQIWSNAAMQISVTMLSNGFERVAEGSKKMFTWSECFERFLPVSCFATDPSQARKVFGNFLREDLEVEKTPMPIDPSLGKLQLSIASTFRDEPFDTENLLKAASKSRKKRTKALLAAWLALQGDDQEKFSTSIATSVKEYAEKESLSSSPSVTIAPFESGLVGLAYERGWKDLQFPFETACRLITHQSLGMH